MYPFTHSALFLHICECWYSIQTLCLFFRLQSLLSLTLFYPSILPSSSCLFKSRAGGRVPEGISLRNMKSFLLWVYSRALSPCSDSFTAKQQQLPECSHGRKHHILLLDYSRPGPREQSVIQMLFPATAERGERDQTKGGGSLRAPLKCVSLSVCLNISASFIQSPPFSLLFKSFISCSSRGEKVTFWICSFLKCPPLSLCGFHCFRLHAPGLYQVLIFRTFIYVIQIRYASQVTRAPSYC